MNLTRLVNDYTECEKFEIWIDESKIKIFYYDSIKEFSNTKIIILKNKKEYIFKGRNLVIDTMFKEYLIIVGNILAVEIGKANEQ